MIGDPCNRRDCPNDLSSHRQLYCQRSCQVACHHGAPRRDPDATVGPGRNRRACIWFTPEEHARFRHYAEANEMPLPLYLHQLLTEELP